MRKTNKKGFTIVELVIVIAVIAILAAVMIPTFGGAIEKAQISAAQQEVAAAYKEAYALALSDGKITANGETQTSGKFTFTFKEEAATGSAPKKVTCTVAVTSGNDFDFKCIKVVDGAVTVSETHGTAVEGKCPNCKNTISS